MEGTWRKRGPAIVLISALVLTGCGLIIPPVPPPPDRTGVIQQTWLLRSVAGNQLEIAVDMGGCQGFVDVDVIETETTVEIRTWIEQLDSEVCFAVRLFHPLTVTLRVPLGDRELLGCQIEQGGQPYNTRENRAEIVE